MDSLRTQWDDIAHKWKDWTSSIWGQEPKDYHKMIVELDTPSVKDQTIIFKMRSTSLLSTVLGGLLSSTTAYWAATRTI